MKELLLVDLNYLYNKYYYVALYSGKSDVHASCHSMLLEFLHRIPATYKVIYCVDGEESKLGEYYEGYKKLRKKKTELYSRYNEFQHILAREFPDSRVLVNKYAEGDELIAYFALKNKGKKTTVFSGDKDLLQLSVIRGVNITDTFRNGKFINLTKLDIRSKFKYTAGKYIKNVSQILPFRVFTGDKSDNIPPAISRLKYTDKRVLVYFINKLGFYGMIKDYDLEFVNMLAKQLSIYKHTKLAEKVLANKNNIIRNYSLMNLLCVYKREYIEEDIRRVL